MQDQMTLPVFSSKAALARGLRLAPVLALVCGLALSGCGRFTETFQRGYVLQEGALEQIPVGASQEQVLIVLGTPSTVATVNGEVFYYISQKAQRGAAFLKQEVIDQRVIAVYFDNDPQSAGGSPITVSRTARFSTSCRKRRRPAAKTSTICAACSRT